MFFLCWVIHWYKDDMLSVLNGSLSKSLKCWYDRPGCSVNTSVCWICRNSSSTSFSGELCVCFPDPRMLFRPWLTLPVRDLAPLSAWQIHWTALSVKFGPTFLALPLIKRLECSTSKSWGILQPFPHWLLMLRFQSNLSLSVGERRDWTRNDW